MTVFFHFTYLSFSNQHISNKPEVQIKGFETWIKWKVWACDINNRNLFYLLQATGAKAASTLQRTHKSHHFLSQVILNMEDERAQWSTELSVAAVVFLSYIEHLLPHTVLHSVFIIGLPAQYNCDTKQSKHKQDIKMHVLVKLCALINRHIGNSCLKKRAILTDKLFWSNIKLWLQKYKAKHVQLKYRHVN